MRETKSKTLQRRADAILKKCRLNKPISNQDISQLIDELTLYQIELENNNEDLMKAQVELNDARRKYIELYDLAPAGYFVINKEGLIKEVNQAGCDLLGLRKHALINRCFSRYIASEFKALFSDYRRRAFKELSLQSYELKLLSWNQPSFYAFIECKAVKSSHTGCHQLLTFVTDISARKCMEDTLHQQRIKMASIDRLRSLNEFIYAIAHDQNYSLMMMSNYLNGSIRRLEKGHYHIDELLNILKKAACQSHALADIILRRKYVTSKSIFRYEYDNINTIISQTISLLIHEMIEFPVTIQYEKTDTLSMVKLDKFHIQQAILNLARNAIEAMRDSNIKEPKLLIEAAQTKKDMIEITLFDNGPGLVEELIPKLFEPHYTTKSYGIGLGLTVSRAIIEKHGGQLFALSNPSGGACFGFTLPCLTPLK